RHLPYVASFVCHPFDRGRLRHSHRAGPAGSQGCGHHANLYPCAQPWRAWSAQPAGSHASPIVTLSVSEVRAQGGSGTSLSGTEGDCLTVRSTKLELTSATPSVLSRRSSRKC